MDIGDWKRMARSRIESGTMSEAEWDSVCAALLIVSEGEGIELFDDGIIDAWNAAHPESPGRPSDTAVYVGLLGCWVGWKGFSSTYRFEFKRRVDRLVRHVLSNIVCGLAKIDDAPISAKTHFDSAINELANFTEWRPQDDELRAHIDEAIDHMAFYGK